MGVNKVPGKTYRVIESTVVSHQPACFVIMPFTVKPGDLEKYLNDTNHWIEVYDGLIVPALEKSGFKVQRDDDDLQSRLIVDNIWNKIEDADLVLCDLSSGNPNTFLELGWALRSDKKFILIKDDITSQYFDLNQYYTYQYSHLLQPSQLQKSIKELSLVIEQTINDKERRYSIAKKVGIKHQSTIGIQKDRLEIQLLNQILNDVQQFSRSKGTTGGFDFPEIVKQFRKILSIDHLQKFLIYTTWKKANNYETITFQDKNTFVYKNFLTKEQVNCKYIVGPELTQMTIVWGMDNFEAEAKFDNEFTGFFEVYNPSYRWNIVG
ncbi:hypothetical protein [Flavitalea sp.]|nr:hypothetical protein [Flavitalea sp.]